MILTIINPKGERWSVDPAPKDVKALAAWVTDTFPAWTRRAVADVLLRTRGCMVPKGRAIVAQDGRTGWQAIVSNP